MCADIIFLYIIFNGKDLSVSGLMLSKFILSVVHAEQKGLMYVQSVLFDLAVNSLEGIFV